MNREELNQLIDGLLSLAPPGSEKRRELVELATLQPSWIGLVSEWLWLNQRSLEAAIYLKVWLGWPYRRIGEVYGLDFREVSQLIKSQRMERLGSYPPPQEEEVPDYAGISCFMVDQNLSPWIDSEWEKSYGLAQVYQHVEACKHCLARRELYWKLQSQILEERRSVPPIDVEEWTKIREAFGFRQRKKLIKWMILLFFIFFVLGTILWMIQSQPEKMPNIYEIGEDIEN